MKRVSLFRHSTKNGIGDSELSPEGIELAKKIGQKLRGQEFTRLYISPLSRSGATMKAMAEGAGDFPEQEPKLFPPHGVSATPDGMALWQGVCHEAEKVGEDMMQAALNQDAEVANKVAHDGAEAFQTWIATLPENANVLVVHHSPFLELIAYGLFGEVMPRLQPCEGFQVVEENGVLKMKKVFRE